MRSRSAFDHTLSSALASGTSAESRKKNLAVHSSEYGAHDLSATASCVSRSAKDLISEVRYAASSLFIQRTRDLTCNEALQEHVIALTEELGSLQRLYSSLAAEQAKIDAVLEEAHQKQKERTEALKGVHAAMVQVTDDQQLCSKVFKTTERVAHAVNGFIHEIVNGGFDSPTIVATTARSPNGSHTQSSLAISSSPEHPGSVRTPEDETTSMEPFSLDSKNGIGGGSAHQSMAINVAILMHNSSTFIQGRSAEEFEGIIDAVRSRTAVVKQALKEMRVSGACTSLGILVSRIRSGELSLPGSAPEVSTSRNVVKPQWELHQELLPLHRLLTFMEGLDELLDLQWNSFLKELSAPVSFPNHPMNWSSSTSQNTIVLPRMPKDGTWGWENGDEGRESASSIRLLMWLPSRMYASAFRSHPFASHEWEANKKSEKNVRESQQEKAVQEQDVPSVSILDDFLSFAKESEPVAAGALSPFLGYFIPFLSPKWEIPSVIPKANMRILESLFPPLPSTMEGSGGMEPLLHEMFFSFRSTDINEENESEEEESFMDVTLSFKGKEVQTIETLDNIGEKRVEEEVEVDDWVLRHCPLRETGEAVLSKLPKKWTEASNPAEEKKEEDVGWNHSPCVTSQNTKSQCAANFTPSLCSPSSGPLPSNALLLSSSSPPPLPMHPSILYFLCILARRMETLNIMAKEVSAVARMLGIPSHLQHFNEFQEQLGKEGQLLIEKSMLWAEGVVTLQQHRRELELKRKTIKHNLLPSYEQTLTRVTVLQQALHTARSPSLPPHPCDGGSTNGQEDLSCTEEEKQNAEKKEGSSSATSSSSPPSSIAWTNLWKSLSNEYRLLLQTQEEVQHVEEALHMAQEELSLCQQKWASESDVSKNELKEMQSLIEKEELLLAQENESFIAQQRIEMLMSSQQKGVDDIQCKLSHAVEQWVCCRQPRASLFSPPLFSTFSPAGHYHEEKRKTDETSANVSGKSASSVSLSPADGTVSAFIEEELHSLYSTLLSLFPFQLPPQGTESCHPLSLQVVVAPPDATVTRNMQGLASLEADGLPVSVLSRSPFEDLSTECLNLLSDALFATYEHMEKLQNATCNEQKPSRMELEESVKTAFPLSSVEKEPERQEKDEEHTTSFRCHSEPTVNAEDELGFFNPPLGVPGSLYSIAPSLSTTTPTTFVSSKTSLLSVQPSLSSREDEASVMQLKKEGQSAACITLPSIQEACSSISSEPKDNTLSLALFYQMPIYEWLQSFWENRMVSLCSPSLYEKHKTETVNKPEEEKVSERHSLQVEKVPASADCTFSFHSVTELSEFLRDLFLKIDVTRTSKMVMDLLIIMMSTEIKYRRSVEMFEKYKSSLEEEIQQLQAQLM